MQIMSGVYIMSLVEIQETIKKHVTVIKKTIIRPSLEAIIAIPKKKENRIEREENG